MRYFKRRWDESRGDGYDAWGPSVWYFQVGPDGFPTRQLELYDNGVVLKYDENHLSDQFGALADQPLDFDDFAPFEIPARDFEDIWSACQPAAP